MISQENRAGRNVKISWRELNSSYLDNRIKSTHSVYELFCLEWTLELNEWTLHYRSFLRFSRGTPCIHFREEQSFFVRFPPFARTVDFLDCDPIEVTAIPKWLLISISGCPAEARARKTRARCSLVAPLLPFFSPDPSLSETRDSHRGLGTPATIVRWRKSRHRRSSRRVLAQEPLEYRIHNSYN